MNQAENEPTVDDVERAEAEYRLRQMIGRVALSGAEVKVQPES